MDATQQQQEQLVTIPSGGSIPSTREMAKLLGEMRNALQSLDKNLSREFRQALEAVPSLVALETPLECFLRTDQYNPLHAATRLAHYWKSRRELFHDRWLLPMTQSGTGALSLQDIILLRSGFMTYVPGPPQKTIIMNYNKTNEEMKDLNGIHQRLSVYIATVLCKENDSQYPGLLLAHYVTPEHAEKMKFTGGLQEMIQRSLPVKVSRCMVAQLYDPNKSVHLLDFLRFRVSSMTQFNMKLCPDQYYSHSVADMLANLEQAGFTKSVVPTIVGGTMDIDEQISSWTRMRLSIEDVTAPRTSLSLSNVPHELAVFSSTTRTSKRRENDGNNNHREPLSPEARRARGAMYSRRSYHRRQVNIASLKNQIEILTARNEECRRESKRLEDLLSQAKLILMAPLANKDGILPWNTLQTSSLAMTCDQQAPYSLDSDTLLDRRFF